MLVYALADRPLGPVRMRGVAGESLRQVTVGKVTAIVSGAGRMSGPTTESLQRYDAVIRTLAARAPALLPARFGTSMAEAAELEYVLRQRQETLMRALRHVRGRVQMTVRVTLGKRDAGRAVSPRSETHAGGSGATGKLRRTAASGTTYLRERAAAAAFARTVPGFEPLRAAVARFVRDERVEKRDRLATVYHLIPRRSADAYRKALMMASRRASLAVTVSGPWAPYAFTEA